MALSESPVSAGRSLQRRRDPYRPLRRIARGEMSELVLAEPASRSGAGWVVIKRLRAERQGDDESVSALRREIELAGRLVHPRLPRVRERRIEGVSPWMAMEYVDGPDLARVLLELGKRDRRLDLRSVHAVLVAVVDALRFLHEKAGALLGGGAQGRPVLHNAVGPQNILVGAHGDVRLADLGHAWFTGRNQPRARTTIGLMSSLTPEALRDQPVSERTDIFLVGGLLYECLTGRHPFLRDTVQETAREVGRGAPVPVDALRPVPPELSDLTHRCLAIDPAARPASMAELADALARLPLPGREDGTRVLVKELRALFPEHNDASRPWVLRGRGFHPSFLPMVSSWLPAPNSTLDLVSPPSVEGRPARLVDPEASEPRRGTWADAWQSYADLDEEWEVASEDGISLAPWEPAPFEARPDDPTPLQPVPSLPPAAPLPAAPSLPREAPSRPPGWAEPERMAAVPVVAAAALPGGAPPVVPPEPPPAEPVAPSESVAPSEPEPPAPPPSAPEPQGVSVPVLFGGILLGALVSALLVALLMPRAPAPLQAPRPASDPTVERVAPPPREPPPSPTVRVTLQTVPPGARVSVDGQPLGTSPIELRREPGTLVQVQVRADGHRPLARLVTIPAQGGPVALELAPLDAAPQ